VARLAFVLEPCGDIDPIPKNVVAIDDDVANVYSHPKLETRPTPCRSFRHFLLNLDSAGHGIDGTCGLHQHAVAGSLYDAAVVLGDGGIDDLLPQFFQGCQSAHLVGPHQARVTGNISRQHRR
jgi:hypothetical protein